MKWTAAAAAFILGLSMTCCSTSRTHTGEEAGGAAAKSDSVSGETGRRIVAYYFHGTYRCATCLFIEEQSKETVEHEFADLLKEGSVAFQSLNYDEPENAHFEEAYSLTVPSLVLSLRENGREIAWKNLAGVWDRAQAPEALRDYVAAELRDMLMNPQ